jgi:hypothetical protein
MVLTWLQMKNDDSMVHSFHRDNEVVAAAVDSTDDFYHRNVACMMDELPSMILDKRQWGDCHTPEELDSKEVLVGNANAFVAAALVVRSLAWADICGLKTILYELEQTTMQID